MTMQRESDPPSGSPIDEKAAPGRVGCDCDPSVMPHRDTVCRDEFAVVTLSIIRFVAAAYATSEAACWEAAFQFADETVGTEDGALLVARVATLVRAVRRSLNRELACLPSPCNRLTVDEKRLILLIQANLGEDPGERSTTASALVNVGQQAEILQAAKMISDLSPRPAMARPRWALNRRSHVAKAHGLGRAI